MFKAFICMLLAFNSADVFADQYADALTHAQAAFLIQSGIKDNLNKLETYAKNKGKIYITKIGLANPAKYVLFGYAICRSKSIQIPINNSNKLELHLDHISYIINL